MNPGGFRWLALLLVMVGLIGPLDAVAEQHEHAAGLDDEPTGPSVPGTGERDVLATAARSWRVQENQDPDADPVLVGVAEDPRFGEIAVAVLADAGMIEAVYLQRQDDALRPAINVGAALSSIRLGPPLELDDGARLDTVDVPRLPWKAPQWSNETRQDTMQLVIETEAHLPHPGGNTTSPPLGMNASQQGETTQTGLTLHWRIEFTEKPLYHLPTGMQSPAAIRFSWTLNRSGDEPLPDDQEHLWRLRYDYDTHRQAVRPDNGVTDSMDGVYLIAQDHRAGLRVSPRYEPQLMDPRENETPGTSLLEIDVHPAAGGADPATEPRVFPPPLIVEGRGRPSEHPARGYTLTGEIVFHEAATADGEGDGGDDEPPAGPGRPSAPGPWPVLLVLAAAVLVTVPGAQKRPGDKPISRGHLPA